MPTAEDVEDWMVERAKEDGFVAIEMPDGGSITIMRRDVAAGMIRDSCEEFGDEQELSELAKTPTAQEAEEKPRYLIFLAQPAESVLTEPPKKDFGAN